MPEGSLLNLLLQNQNPAREAPANLKTQHQVKEVRQKDKYWVIPLRWNIYNRCILRDKSKRLQGTGVWGNNWKSLLHGQFPFDGVMRVLELERGDGCSLM